MTSKEAEYRLVRFRGVEVELYRQISTSVRNIQGTPLKSGRVTHFKIFFLKTCFFLLLTCIGHNRLSCGTFTCLLLVGDSFKTCIISVIFRKALQRFSMFNRYFPILKQVAKSIEPRGHIKVPQNKF